MTMSAFLAVVLLCSCAEAAWQEKRSEPMSDQQEPPPPHVPWNITSIILEGYDRRLRPNFGNSKKPVYVNVDLVIGSVDEISEVNMDFTLTIYLRQYWKDHRLAFKDILDPSVTMMPVDGRMADKMWLPDTYFTNDKDSYLQDITVKNRMIRIMPDGNVVYGLRLSITASCVFELKKFPHDTQNCSLNLESYGYSQKDIRLVWDKPNCVAGFEDVELPQFRITAWQCTANVANFSSGYYDRIHMHFILSREVGFFVFQTYMPCIMVVCMSWVSFWINYESSPGRVNLGITTVLTMTTIFTSSRASLPRFSYVKAIDIYLLVCFVFVFASLIEYAIVNFNYWKITHEKNREQKHQQRLAVALNSTQPMNNDNKEMAADELIAMRLSQPELVAAAVHESPGVNQSPTLLRRKKRSLPDPSQRSPYAGNGGQGFGMRPGLERQGETLTSFNRGFIRTIQMTDDQLGQRSGFVCQANNDIYFRRLKSPGGQPNAINIVPNQAYRNSTGFPQGGLPHQYPLGALPCRVEQPRTEWESIKNSLGMAYRFIGRLWSKIPIPTGGDVIIIDTYSRIFFPTAFVIFNFIYWWHYIMDSNDQPPAAEQ